MGAMDSPSISSFNTHTSLSVPTEGPVSSEKRVQVGADYQIAPPKLLSLDTLSHYREATDNSTCLWSPYENGLSESEIVKYLSDACSYNDFTEEQSLAMLSWHNFDVDSALEDIKKYSPVDNTRWCDHDRISFENAFKNHGKSFDKLQQAVPHKSLAEVVSFYYKWKKQRIKTTVMDLYITRWNNQQDCSYSFSESDEDELLIEHKRRKLSNNQVTTTHNAASSSTFKRNSQQPLLSTATSTAASSEHASKASLNHYPTNCQFSSRNHASGDTDLIHLDDNDDDEEEDDKQRRKVEEQSNVSTVVETTTKISSSSSSSGAALEKRFYDLPSHLKLSSERLSKLSLSACSWEEEKMVKKYKIDKLKAELRSLVCATNEIMKDCKLMNVKESKRTYSQMQKSKRQRLPDWTQSEEMTCVRAIHKYGMDNLNAVVSVMQGSKSIEQVLEFVNVARIKYRLDELLNQQNLTSLANSGVAINANQGHNQTPNNNQPHLNGIGSTEETLHCRRLSCSQSHKESTSTQVVYPPQKTTADCATPTHNHRGMNSFVPPSVHCHTTTPNGGNVSPETSMRPLLCETSTLQPFSSHSTFNNKPTTTYTNGTSYFDDQDDDDIVEVFPNNSSKH